MQAATTTEPFRAPLPRSISAFYPTAPHHGYHPLPLGPIVRRVSSESDTLRLYDPAPYAPDYRYQQPHPHPHHAHAPMYATAPPPPFDRERRLAYPASTVGLPPYAPAEQYAPQYAPPLFLPQDPPHAHAHAHAPRDVPPRYFAAAPDAAL